jgi:hypothetical protein
MNLAAEIIFVNLDDLHFADRLRLNQRLPDMNLSILRIGRRQNRTRLLGKFINDFRIHFLISNSFSNFFGLFTDFERVFAQRFLDRAVEFQHSATDMR